MTSNCTLASIALFSKLYDSQKNIYSLIYDFIKSAVLSTSEKRTFTSLEITNFVNDYYKFEIPESVIKTVLQKNLPEKMHNYNLVEKSYVFSTSISACTDTTNNYKALQCEYELIFSNLISYIKIKSNTELTNDDQVKVQETFYNILLGNTPSNEFSAFIGTFISSLDLETTEKLNSIREGLIIYEGVIYTPDLSSIGSWRDKITFFLSTEHLFHLAGYNGETYKKIFMDFYNLVKEINVKKQLIELMYFNETKIEIEKYFLSAQNNLENRQVEESSAMKNILSNCNSPSDVIMKQTKFFNLLKSFNIKEDTYTKYWIEENNQYNIIGVDTYNNIIQDKEEECKKLLEQLNKVSILRQGSKEKSFNKSKALFISDNKTTYTLQKNLMQNEEQYYLASSLDSVINKLWFSLNKGFSDKTKLPISFDVAIKAKLAISNQLSQKIKEGYAYCRERYSDLSESDITNFMLRLKEKAQKAEDLDFDNDNEILEFISTDILTLVQREKENQIRKTKIGEKNIIELITRKKIDLSQKKARAKKLIRNSIVYHSIMSILFFTIILGIVLGGAFYTISMLRSENDTILGIISLLVSIPIVNFMKFVRQKIENKSSSFRDNIKKTYKENILIYIQSLYKTQKELEEIS